MQTGQAIAFAFKGTHTYGAKLCGDREGMPQHSVCLPVSIIICMDEIRAAALNTHLGLQYNGQAAGN